MSIYDQNFSTIFQQLLPPDKRLPKNIAWGTVITTPIQWLHDLTFEDYAKGTTASFYSNVAAYSKGDRAIYNQNVYEAKQSTTGNAPTTGDDSDVYWILVLNDFRGARERVRYNGQKLVLEWILNKWFNTTFIQPDYNFPSVNSDIWIETLITDDGSFLVGSVSPQTSFVSADSSLIFQEDHISDSYPGSNTPYNFVVHYPLAVIPGLDTDIPPDKKYIQMKALVNKYRCYGSIPNFVGY